MTELAKDLEQRLEQAATEGAASERSETTSITASGGSGTVSQLVTEREVLMGSSAAMAGPPARPTVWQRMREYFEAWQSDEKRSLDADDDRKPPRFFPERYDFVESAAMAREMWRL